jgi:hypothetical protein
VAFEGGTYVRYEIPSSAYFSLIQDIESFTQTIFLPFMGRIRFFEIYAEFAAARDFDILSSLIGSLCISLTYSTTLEHLDFNIRFCGVPFLFDFNMFYENLRNPNLWSHLDSLTTHPTSSRSRLQRVNINIKCDYTDEDEVLNAVFDGLPLLRTKGILFVKAASEDSE